MCVHRMLLLSDDSWMGETGQILTHNIWPPRFLDSSTRSILGKVKNRQEGTSVNVGGRYALTGLQLSISNMQTYALTLCLRTKILSSEKLENCFCRGDELTVQIVDPVGLPLLNLELQVLKTDIEN